MHDRQSIALDPVGLGSQCTPVHGTAVQSSATGASGSDRRGACSTVREWLDACSPVSPLPVARGSIRSVQQDSSNAASPMRQVECSFLNVTCEPRPVSSGKQCRNRDISLVHQQSCQGIRADAMTTPAWPDSGNRRANPCHREELQRHRVLHRSFLAFKILGRRQRKRRRCTGGAARRQTDAWIKSASASADTAAPGR